MSVVLFLALAAQPELMVPPAPVEAIRPADAADPVLELSNASASPALFRSVIEASVQRHPLVREREASRDEAEHLVDAAQEARLPSVDATLQYYSVIDRAFSDDPQNIIERSRARERTDAIVSLNQTVFDFGAGSARVRAAAARVRASAAEIESSAESVAINAVAAWYDIFAARALTGISAAALDSLREARSLAQLRVGEGVLAEVDLARVDTFISQTEVQLARFRRQLARAEARFAELTGTPAPAELDRAPAPTIFPASREEAIERSERSAAVRSAEAQAAALRADARAAEADLLPQVSAGIDAGRYGVFENARDFDVRGRLTLRMRLFGGAEPRARSVSARARSVEARADRVREEIARETAIAWSDVQALADQLEALERAYLAARQTRDATVARFRAVRGTLFDVMAAEEALFVAAAATIQGLAELDTARYILLTRTGDLLDALEIQDPALRMPL